MNWKIDKDKQIYATESDSDYENENNEKISTVTRVTDIEIEAFMFDAFDSIMTKFDTEINLQAAVSCNYQDTNSQCYQYPLNYLAS